MKRELTKETMYLRCVDSFARLPITEGRCKATWKREFKLPCREAGPPNHHDDKVDLKQYIVNEEHSLPITVHDGHSYIEPDFDELIPL